METEGLIPSDKFIVLEVSDPNKSVKVKLARPFKFKLARSRTSQQETRILFSEVDDLVFKFKLARSRTSHHEISLLLFEVEDFVSRSSSSSSLRGRGLHTKRQYFVFRGKFLVSRSSSSSSLQR